MIDVSNLQIALQALNFSEKESLVYLAILELHEALPSVISRKVGLKRPTTYLTLEHLFKRGLLTRVKKKGVLYYQASQPEIFLTQERKRIQDSQSKLEILEKSIPELLSLHQKYAATPQMSVFYGKEGIIQIMEDTLTTKGELLCWSNVEVAESTFLTEYHPSYVKKKVQKKIR